MRPTQHPEKMSGVHPSGNGKISQGLTHQRRMRGPTKVGTTTKEPLHISAWRPSEDRVASFRVHV